MFEQLTIEELDIICQIPHHVVISAGHGWNLDELKEKASSTQDALRCILASFYSAVPLYGHADASLHCALLAHHSRCIVLLQVAVNRF
jgi:hypothetical protein